MRLKNDAKVEEKLNLGSKNDMINLENFNANSGKSTNLHFDLLFLLKIYYVCVQKSTEELYVITLKNDEKFEEEMTCALKNDMMNLANFDPTLESLSFAL